MIIYKITNLINGKIYIGQDKDDKSWYFGSGLLIKRAIKKYGKENFKKETIDIAVTKEELTEKEKYWIKELCTQDPTIGYNIADGGEGGDTLTNHPNIDDIKKKISIGITGQKNPNFGKFGKKIIFLVHIKLKKLKKRSVNLIVENLTECMA